MSEISVSQVQDFLTSTISIDSIAVNLGWHPLWLYSIAGGVILVFFSAQRLDRMEPDEADGVDPPDTSHFHDFVSAFRPSEVGMSRVFRSAWAAYTLILLAIYAVAVLLFASMYGLLSLGTMASTAGLVLQNLVTNVSNVTLDVVVPAPSDATGASPSNTQTVFEIDENLSIPVQTTADAAIGEGAKTSATHLEPVLLAMLLVGLLPSFWANRFEAPIRDASLFLAGIPRKVVETWEALRETALIYPVDYSEDKNLSQLDCLVQRKALLVNVYQCLTQLMRNPTQSDENEKLLGHLRDTHSQDFDSLALVFLFEELTREEEDFVQWPEKETINLYGRRNLKEVREDILTFGEDLQYFCDLYDVNQVFVQYHPYVVGGMNDPQHASVQQDNLENPLMGLRERQLRRWKTLTERAALIRRRVIALMSLYIEREPELPNGEIRFALLSDWVRRARDPGPPLTLPNIIKRWRPGIFVRFVFPVFLFSGWLFAARYQTLNVQLNAEELAEIWGLFRYDMLQGFYICIAAGIPSFNIRSRKLRRHDWKRFGRVGSSGCYLHLAFVVFFYGMAFAFAAYAISAYYGFPPYTTPQPLPRTFAGIWDETTSYFTFEMWLLWAAKPVVLAIFTAAACDFLEPEPNGQPVAHRSLKVCLIMIAIGALCLSGLQFIDLFLFNFSFESGLEGSAGEGARQLVINGAFLNKIMGDQGWAYVAAMGGMGASYIALRLFAKHPVADRAE